MIGGEYNAIEVYSANNLNISSNTVESYSDMASYIAVKSANNVTMNNNIATSYQLASNNIISQLSNQTIGVVSAVASTSVQAITAVAEAASVAERQTLSGNALVGDQGNGLYLADVGVGAAAQKTVAGSGSTFTGTYGTLTVQTDGSYSYTATKEGLIVGQSYDDHFTITVANGHGGVQSSTLDFIVGGSGLGTAAANNIIGGAGAETITGLGGADGLISGSGPDTFAYTSVADSTPTAFDTIRGFKSGDSLDLSGVDPNFRIVTAFDHHADELIVKNDGNGAWDIFGDTTGSGVANFQIHLSGATTTLSGADIHL